MPKVHTFDSSSLAYDMSQCDDKIKDGDILSVPSERVVGILIEAWPTAISEECGAFHSLHDPQGFEWDAVPVTSAYPAETPKKDYSKSFDLATEELDRICLAQAEARENSDEQKARDAQLMRQLGWHGHVLGRKQR